jgi:TonB family protein
VIGGSSTEPSQTSGDGRYGGGLSASGIDHSSLRLPMPAGSGSEKVDPYNETLDFATVMPEIVGGPDAFRLQYPDFERRAAIGGRVVVRFVVDIDGRVVEPEIVRGVGPGLDSAALDALRRLRFRPARQNGQPARVRMTLTFNFDAASGSAGY